MPFNGTSLMLCTGNALLKAFSDAFEDMRKKLTQELQDWAAVLNPFEPYKPLTPGQYQQRPLP